MNVKGESTLGKVEKYLNLKRYSINTIKIYMHYISEFIYSFYKPALHITIKDCENYIRDYSFSSRSKQNQVISSIKVFSKVILHKDLSSKLEFKRPRKKRSLPRVIDDKYLIEELNKIENLKHKALLMLTYSVGLRVSDVINLKISDIDSKRMIIHIKNGKGGKDRVNPLSVKMLSVLRSYYREYKPKEYLFNGQKNLQYTPSSCNKIVKRYLGDEYHMHMLRHSSATFMLENGTDLPTISNILGHEKVSTTMIYTHVSIKHLQNANLPL